MIRENLSIVILAAGKGKRMRSQKAKVLHEIIGEPMLFHIIRSAQKITNDITVVVFHQAEKVISTITSVFPEIKFHFQNDDEFPGTGGALRDIQFQNDNILVLNGDMPLVTSEELQRFLFIDSDIIMGTIRLQNPTGYGRVVTHYDEVMKIVEERDATAEEKEIYLVNSGVYLFKKEILEKYLTKLTSNNSQKEYYLTDIIGLARNGGYKIKSIEIPETIFKGVNSKFDLAEAEKILLNRIKKEAMQNGVTMHLPETIFIDSQVEFIGECEIEPNVVIKGKTKITSSIIKAGTVIEDSIIENSTIGVMAHIRPNSIIKNSKIGNFVEVKKSNLEGVKAGHLSYLGDCEIHENTNIGAGVITANYDGKRKYKTVIGKNVFVGSDSQLIAPVNIPDNIMIAAGTTVPSETKIEEGSLVISRTNLRKISKFFYKFFGKKDGN